MLSTTQLQLAYSALVQSAENHNNFHGTSDLVALAWYCIETLVEAIRELSKITLDAHIMAPPATESHLHRLHLTLIATVPSLPLPLMLHVLDRIRDIILEKDLSSVCSDIDGNSNEKGDSTPPRKAQLVDALSREILERVGDMEKEAVMKWWYANLEELRSDRM
jgi:hypothetical protein